MDAKDPRVTRLKELVEQRAILRGAFTLSSGLKSSYYFDGRRVTHDPEAISLVGALLEEALERAGAEAIGGPATGANPIITATQVAAFQKGRRLGGFYVRSQPKEHGTEALIEGDLPGRGARVAMVDDTVTTGASLERAIAAVESAGCRVVRVFVLIDRQQGGAERLRSRGYDVQALFVAEGDRIRVAG